MDIFSADLPEGAFKKMPASLARPTVDPDTAELIVEALATAKKPVLYVGGGVLSGRATAELAALAEALEVPVAHTLMGKGCLREDHPLLLGQTGFWGTPIANDTCRSADLIVAIGTRLAEANSSSWDSRFTFAIPPTRLIHIDADPAEIGRNYPTEVGVVADAKATLVCWRRLRGRPHESRGRLRGYRPRPKSVCVQLGSPGVPASFRCAPSAF
jgi:acetolactate synthase-1/2/3 large subunit